MTNRQSQSSKRRISILVAYFLIYVVWGSTYYFIGIALKGFPPFLLGAFRFSAAGVILLGWCYMRGESIFKKSIIKKSAISGIVLLFIDMAAVMLAQQYMSSSLVAIIASSTAIWIIALDKPMWKVNFRNPAVVIAVIIGFLGVAMLYIEQLNVSGIYVHGTYGILILVFGCISWALGTLYTKYRSPAEEEVNAFAGTAWQMLIASGFFWICSFANDDIANIDLNTIPAYAWFSLIYLILFGSILAYSAYVWLLKVRPATEVSTHAYVNPFIAVFLGISLGKENVTLIQVIGLIVIILSLMLMRKKIHNGN